MSEPIKLFYQDKADILEALENFAENPVLSFEKRKRVMLLAEKVRAWR